MDPDGSVSWRSYYWIVFVCFVFRISVYYLDRLGLFKLVCDTWRICYGNKVVAYSCVPSLSSLARIYIYIYIYIILVRISINLVTHTHTCTYSRCAHRAQTYLPCNVVLCSCPQAMLCCVVLIVQFSSRNTSYCSGCGFAATCMDCWWDEGCYPCSYCGGQYGATHLAWLCVDVWYLRPRADLDWDLEAWEPERVHFQSYELFSNLHVVWNDRC